MIFMVYLPCKKNIRLTIIGGRKFGFIKGLMAPIAILTAIVVLYGVGAEGITEYILIASKTLMDPSVYIDAVLNR